MCSFRKNGKENENFWEEQIAYFPFTVILLSDTASREKTLVRNAYTVDIASDGMICIPNYIKFGSGIQVIFRTQPPQHETL
jgi:hypothetical protein